MENKEHCRDGVLIIAELEKERIHPVTFELLGKGREIADVLGCELSTLLLCVKVKHLEKMIS